MRLLKKLVCDEGEWCFIQYPPGTRLVFDHHPKITAYVSSRDVPQSFHKDLFLGGRWDLLRRRLDGGTAQVWCYSEDGIHLAGFGWIQDWKHFRRKFGKIAPDGVMLGPFWTSPEHRNKGIFKLLRREMSSHCPADQTLIIYSKTTNAASQRGALAGGGTVMGFYRVTFWFRLFSVVQSIPAPPGFQENVLDKKIQHVN